MPDVRRASAVLFLLALSVLLLEIAFTRVFSVMSYHHFAYLIISLALLGFGAAGSYMTVSSRFAGDVLEPKLVGRLALLFSLSVLLAFAAATKVSFRPMDVYLYRDYSNLFSLLMLYLIVGVPFFLGGLCIGYLISRGGEAVNQLYFADLVGAGMGALLSIVGINHLGAEATIYAAAGMGGIAAMMMAAASRDRWGQRGSAAALALCGLMTVQATRSAIFPVYFPPDKLPHEVGMEPHYYRWHVVARVDVMNPTDSLVGVGAMVSSRCKPEFLNVPMRMVYQDGTAPTAIFGVPNGDLSRLPALDYCLQGAPYIAKPAPQRALIIGVGGGADVLIALRQGTRFVRGVEVNPVTVEAVKTTFGDFAGRIFSRPDVDLINAEGRHYLTTTNDLFEVIQMSCVDTFTALSSGAYALSENYLYTVEAMCDYWNHLSPEGILSFSRWLIAPPKEALRLLATELQALDQLGVKTPESHLLVLSATMTQAPWVETLLKKTPFTETEVVRCRQWADQMGFAVLYDPYRKQPGLFDQMIRASIPQRQAMIEVYPFNIRPVSDDDPFFFHFGRWRSLTSPSTNTEAGLYGTSHVPVAILVLLASLLQIVVLAAAFVIGPLLMKGSRLQQTRHKARTLTYFGALGLGFITVEIGLLQKYTVFVGGPVYAMAVTLFAILVFSGLGSLSSARIVRSIPRPLATILLALVVVLVAEVAFANYAVPRLMALSHPMRCVVTIMGLAPLALLMGMPFPVGLRAIQTLGQAMVPWAWGINAVTTTFGALLCVLVSIEWGFTITLLCAGAVYLVAMGVRPSWPPESCGVPAPNTEDPRSS